jgi:hypothetical protein
MAAEKRWKGKEVACAAVTGSVSEASVAALGCVNVETLAGRRNCLRCCCCCCCWAANVRLMLLSVATDTDARFLWNWLMSAENLPPKVALVLAPAK